MLNHLFATLLICLGVANTTPISNYDQKESNLVLTTPKKSNITATYTITLQESNSLRNQYQVADTGNSYYSSSGSNLDETQTNLTNSNSYLNIIGNYYRTQLQRTVIDENNNDRHANFILNDYYLQQNENYRYNNMTCFSYMLQITPYNYNVETTINIRNQIQIEDWTANTDVDFYTYEIYLTRIIYQSTEYTQNPISGVITYPWQEYIGTQLTDRHTYKIEQDITNINNGFYYSKQSTKIKVGQNGVNREYADIFDLQITPTINNYYFIMYIPSLRPVYDTQEITQPMIGYIYQTNTPVITGVNIIPDGTYEVVDIPGLMFEVIGMPFAFVSQAFNLTLFPGTPYQINIANLFLSIAAIFVFVWLLLLFIKMKG